MGEIKQIFSLKLQVLDLGFNRCQ